MFLVTTETIPRDIEISRVVECNTWNVTPWGLVIWCTVPQCASHLWSPQSKSPPQISSMSGVGMLHRAYCRKCLSTYSDVITTHAIKVYLRVEVRHHLFFRSTLHASKQSASRSDRFTSRWSMSYCLSNGTGGCWMGPRTALDTLERGERLKERILKKKQNFWNAINSTRNSVLPQARHVYDMIWYMWYDIYGMIRYIWYVIYGMIWYISYYMIYMICYIWYDMIYIVWYDTYGMLYDMIYMVWWYMWYDIYGMIWYNMIWYMWYDIYIVWYICYMIWYDICDMIYMVWYDMIYVIWYDICDMIYIVWYDMLYDIWYMWYDIYMIWYMWYDIYGMIWYVIWYDIYLLTAIGLSPGGSSTVHIYTQTIHRTTRITTEQHK